MTETVIPLSDDQIQLTLAPFNRRAGSLSVVSVDRSLEVIMAFLGLRPTDHPEHAHRKPSILLGPASEGREPNKSELKAEAANR
jgi:hypothetical protein